MARVVHMMGDDGQVQSGDGEVGVRHPSHETPARCEMAAALFGRMGVVRQGQTLGAFCGGVEGRIVEDQAAGPVRLGGSEGGGDQRPGVMSRDHGVRNVEAVEHDGQVVGVVVDGRWSGRAVGEAVARRGGTEPRSTASGAAETGGGRNPTRAGGPAPRGRRHSGDARWSRRSSCSGGQRDEPLAQQASKRQGGRRHHASADGASHGLACAQQFAGCPQPRYGRAVRADHLKLVVDGQADRAADRRPLHPYGVEGALRDRERQTAAAQEVVAGMDAVIIAAHGAHQAVRVDARRRGQIRQIVRLVEEGTVFLEQGADIVGVEAGDEGRRFAQDPLVEHDPVTLLWLLQQGVFAGIDRLHVLAHEAVAVGVDVDLPRRTTLGIGVQPADHAGARSFAVQQEAEVDEEVLPAAQPSADAAAQPVPDALRIGIGQIGVERDAVHGLIDVGRGGIAARRQHGLGGLEMMFGAVGVAGRNPGHGAAGVGRQAQHFMAQPQADPAVCDGLIDTRDQDVAQRGAAVSAPVVAGSRIGLVADAVDRTGGIDVETLFHQPVERLGGVPYRQPHQGLVHRASAQAHDVVEMRLGVVFDPLVALQARAGRAQLAVGDPECSAQHIGVVDQQDAGPTFRREDGCRHAGGAAADDDEVPGRGLGAHDQRRVISS
uniref:CBS domain-containing protein n=1 Tax=Parastrongyloides trichosuri TaxID=131310 RepID=A0A0N4Z3S5_PARTI